jgi:hypothetical protein
MPHRTIHGPFGAKMAEEAHKYCDPALDKLLHYAFLPTASSYPSYQKSDFRGHVPMSSVKPITIVAVILCILGSAALLIRGGSFTAAPRNTGSMSVRYPGPWRDDTNIPVARALVANNVRGCGGYKYRESSEHRGEYFVHCSRDGSAWLAYIVWPNISKVMGPTASDPGLY